MHARWSVRSGSVARPEQGAQTCPRRTCGDPGGGRDRRRRTFRDRLRRRWHRGPGRGPGARLRRRRRGTRLPSPSPAAGYHRVDAVSMLKRDPAVSAAVKHELKPCGSGDDYPVDVSYGDLTDSDRSDVVVNVLTCADAVGIGAYVYRESGGSYRNVFKTEESPVYAEIDQGALTVTKQVYSRGTPSPAPPARTSSPIRGRRAGSCRASPCTRTTAGRWATTRAPCPATDARPDHEDPRGLRAPDARAHPRPVRRGRRRHP